MIARVTDSFERKQRRCLDLLEESNLFSGAPQLSVAVVAAPKNDHAFILDEECRLTLIDDHLLVVRGVTVVGEIENPPSSVLDTMHGPCPSAFGQVVKLFTLTNKAEIMLEER